MFAVDYEELLIIELTRTNSYEFKHLDSYETFSEAKKEVVSYWEFKVNDSKFNLKKSRKLKQ
jgi:hypothetical protein